jgi:hypothetical protein
VVTKRGGDAVGGVVEGASSDKEMVSELELCWMGPTRLVERSGSFTSGSSEMSTERRAA